MRHAPITSSIAAIPSVLILADAFSWPAYKVKPFESKVDQIRYLLLYFYSKMRGLGSKFK
jgi:hypothetical protein